MNKLKLISLTFVSLSFVSLVGCGQVDRTIAKYTGDPVAVCYQGVEYVQFTSGASVAYNVDGTVRTCK